MWISTNDCEQAGSIHEIKKVDGEWKCFHADGTECERCEFNVRELVEAA